MQSFEFQLFIFSMVTALTVVFILVYNFTRKILGKDDPPAEKTKAKPHPSVQRGAIRRNDTDNSFTSDNEAEGNNIYDR